MTRLRLYEKGIEAVHSFYDLVNGCGSKHVYIVEFYILVGMLTIQYDPNCSNECGWKTNGGVCSPFYCCRVIEWHLYKPFLYYNSSEIVTTSK